MTKRQLIKWLEGKKEDALIVARKKHEELMKEHTESICKILGVRELAEKIQSLFSKIDDEVNTWRNKNADMQDISFNHSYRNISLTVYDYINHKDATFDRIISREFTDKTLAKKNLDNAYSKMQSEINRNYTNVIANVQNLKDAKTGVEYLTELGFDLTELIERDKRPVATALAVDIDAKYLFIQKEVKE